jgi:hypothetical protein
MCCAPTWRSSFSAPCLRERTLADFESYEATADAARAKELAATASPFKIKIRFLGGLNARPRSAFKKCRRPLDARDRR